MPICLLPRLGICTTTYCNDTVLTTGSRYYARYANRLPRKQAVVSFLSLSAKNTKIYVHKGVYHVLNLKKSYV